MSNHENQDLENEPEINFEGEEFEESLEKSPEKHIFKGEDFSEDEAEAKSKRYVHRQSENFDMLDLIQKRSKINEPNVVGERARMIKCQTLGLNITPSIIRPGEIKQEIKVNNNLLIRSLLKYREIDHNEYQKFAKCGDLKEIKRTFHNFYLLHKGYAEKTIVYLLNSYDETGVCRLFQEFYLEFDQNNDKKMQIDELESCIEFLAKDEYVGKEKVSITLKEIGVNCENKLSMLQEGNADKLLNDQTLNLLFKILKSDTGMKKEESEEYVDFMKFAPIVTIFFFEFIVINFLKKKEVIKQYLGYPTKINRKGKAVIDLEGDPEGMYRVLISQLKGETELNKPVVTFKDVSHALISFRSSGFSNSLTMEALERILKQVKELMQVDSISGREAKAYTMKEILPYIVCRVATEMSWETGEFRKSIEKYDKMVDWFGCTYSRKLTKKNLHKMVEEAFAYLPYPTFNQFVKGLDFVLKRMIPTLVSPAAIYIAQKLTKTPDTIISEEGFNGEVKIKFNIRYIITYDDLFERLYYFSMKFQVKLMFVRLLYKNYYANYKKDKRINATIGTYNDIMQIPNLFENLNPGRFGNFEDATMQLLKSRDPEEQIREENERKELKKRRFLEMLCTRDDISDEKRRSRKNVIINRKMTIKGEIVTADNQKTTKEEDDKFRLSLLQAEANRIDTAINKIEAAKHIENSKVRISTAFPNSEDITPEIIMNLINWSKNQSKSVKNLKQYIYREKDNIGYHDIQRFLISEHLKNNKKEGHESIMNARGVYKLEGLFDNKEKLNQSELDKSKSSIIDSESAHKSRKSKTEITTESQKSLIKEHNSEIVMSYQQLDEDTIIPSENFEESYFKDILSRKKKETEIFQSKNQEPKDRGCECLII